MGQVTTSGQGHAQDRVTRLKQGHEYTLIGLRARAGLNIGELATEQFAGAVNGQLFDHIDKLTPAVITLTGIAFGVFVGQHRALGIKNRARHNVLGRNKLDIVLLTLQLMANGDVNFGIADGERGTEEGLGVHRLQFAFIVQEVGYLI